MLNIALYDLDNTLYPATCGLMEQINQRITSFVQERLALDSDTAKSLRRSYYEQYGTTLGGLQRHNNIDAEEYLAFVHDIDIATIVLHNELLYPTLHALPLRRIIFTNSPHEYASRVLKHLGISPLFEHLIDIRACEFLAKPHQRAYEVALSTIGAEPSACVFFEDTPANLGPAKQLGMTTVLIHPDEHLTHPHADYVFSDIISATTHIQQLVQAGAAYKAMPPVTSTTAPLT